MASCHHVPNKRFYRSRRSESLNILWRFAAGRPTEGVRVTGRNHILTGGRPCRNGSGMTVLRFSRLTALSHADQRRAAHMEGMDSPSCGLFLSRTHSHSARQNLRQLLTMLWEET